MDFSRTALESARALVAATLPPTPQYSWPLLRQRLGCTVWVKHENHTPVGAFKVRGGLVWFAEERPRRGVISATRGNHGQSVGFAARRHGVPATIVVPVGSSVEKNQAMRALGVTVIEHGSDFQEAREHATALAERDNLELVPSFHPHLVRGVASGWIEMFESFARGDEPELLFVPIGLGSGFCAAAAARRYTGARTRLVGVVSAHAPAYRDSYRAGRVVTAPATTELADGLACRIPEVEALEVLQREADDVVAVTDDEVAEAMRLLFAATHNVAEGAGAAALAAVIQQRDQLQGRTVAVSLSGGNVDTAVFARVLATP